MSDATINRFLARGTTAQRTAFTPSAPTPSSGPSQGYLWWDTDLQAEYAYDFGLAAWVATGGGGTGTVTHTGALTANAVLVGNGTADIKVGLAAASSKLLGSGASGSGAAYAELTLGTNLSMSGTTLNVSGASALPNTCAGRLTLTTLTPITTTDVTGATTVYFTPYLGNHVSLYTSSTWTDYSFSEVNIAVGTLTSDKNYDIFAYDVGAAVTLKIGPAWSSDTSRGSGAGTTEVTLQDGVYVNANSISSGPGAKAGRYLGTFRTTSTTATEDSAKKRFLWNMQNQTTRSLINAAETTDTWSYNTASYRQANANTANQLAYVCGAAATYVEAAVHAFVNSSVTTASAQVGIGVDSTTANSSQQMGGQALTGSTGNLHYAGYRGYPGLGYHFLAWLELGDGSSTITWWGDAGAAYIQSGIAGTIWN